jgi:TfoX/Sxy family transcriptional regulator of competence genes
MNDWKKVSAELTRRFLAALPNDPRVERRQMFGCPCAFVHGNMFAGLHEDRLIVRIPDEAMHRPCVIMGRTMKQYAAFDDAPSLSDASLAQWIARALVHAAALPAKVKKPRSAAKRKA